MHYLTVQDVLWINLQITKAPQAFSHTKLEEATFYQYGYGGSSDLNAQAARLLVSFPKHAPFATANEATAFVACMAFLIVNGQEITLDDSEASEWIKTTPDASAIEQISRHANGHHESLAPEVRPAVECVLASFPQTIAAMASAVTA